MKLTSAAVLPQQDEHVQLAAAHQHILLELIAVIHLEMQLAVRCHHTATHAITFLICTLVNLFSNISQR